MGFYCLHNEHYFNKKCVVNTNVVNDVTCSRQCIYRRDHMIFTTQCFPLNNDPVLQISRGKSDNLGVIINISQLKHIL